MYIQDVWYEFYKKQRGLGNQVDQIIRRITLMSLVNWLHPRATNGRWTNIVGVQSIQFGISSFIS